MEEGLIAIIVVLLFVIGSRKDERKKDRRRSRCDGDYCESYKINWIPFRGQPSHYVFDPRFKWHKY